MGKVIMSGIVPTVKKPKAYKEIFGDNSWATIVEACKNREVPDTWVVGNSKTMLINGTEYQIDIIGKGHDDYADGSGKAPLTFQMHNCYGEVKNMNRFKTNVGGWTSCAMRQTHLPAILLLMPTEVQNGIREVNKLTSEGDRSTTIKTTADKLFLLSEVEISGNTQYSVAGEGVQYAYYKAGNSKIKNRNGSAYGWWGRSPARGSNSGFCNVYYNGSAGNTVANETYAVAFGFCF